MNGIQFTLAARYLMGRKLRTFLTTLAIILGITILFGLNTMVPSMLQAMRQGLLASAGVVDLSITSETDGTFSPDAVDTVRGVNGIAAATRLLRQHVSLPAGSAES